jgi:poly-gamma-glutamate synthesis protein (capsule biosynthesis protein)
MLLAGQDSIPKGKQALTLMFVGDVMGHGMQISGAYYDELGIYNYDDVFAPMEQIFRLSDFTIANLEVTLAGTPYTGYPQFSSPDELVDGLMKANVNVLVTANNHTVDRGKQGIIRTIDVLKSKGIPFAGAFNDSLHRDTTYPLVLERNGIRLALLNYTYGTNGIPVPKPAIVNLIDTSLIRSDFNKAKSLNVDEVIAFMHWGEEYQQSQSMEQLKLNQFMHTLGIRLVIGSHPHVLQRMEASFDTDSTEGRVTVFSLGNFVSNQRARYRNGGVVSVIQIEKENDTTRISGTGYILVWVHSPEVNGKKRFRVLPVSEHEQKENFFKEDDKKLFEEFVTDSRTLLNRENFNFPEIHYRDGNWLIPWITHFPKDEMSLKIIDSLKCGSTFPLILKE